MRIAILLWGSLYWNPRNLETIGEWFYDGPSLPLEFARISGNNRLTLVIKPDFDYVTTLYTISSNTDLDSARENLRTRENSSTMENIGFVDFISNRQNVRDKNYLIIDILTRWNKDKDFEAIIWSDFAPRFTDQINLPFTLANVISFLDQLPDEEKDVALNYIRKTPSQIETRFRKSIENHFNLNL